MKDYIYNEKKLRGLSFKDISSLVGKYGPEISLVLNNMDAIDIENVVVSDVLPFIDIMSEFVSEIVAYALSPDPLKDPMTSIYILEVQSEPVARQIALIRDIVELTTCGEDIEGFLRMVFGIISAKISATRVVQSDIQK